MKKILKMCDYFVSIIFSISFILATAFIAVIPIASNNQYYMKQFIKNGVGDNLNYTIEELEKITESITNYLFHGASSMQISIDNKDVFSNQAILHMADVKDLFNLLTIAGIISITIIIILCIYIYFRRRHIKKRFRLLTYLTFLLFLLLISVASIYALIDFNEAWTNFHHLFFPDPEKFNNAFFPYNDTLINILTLDFFFDIFFEIIIRFVAMFIILFVIIQTLYSKKIISKFNR